MGRVPKTRNFSSRRNRLLLHMSEQEFSGSLKNPNFGSNILRHISIHKYHTVKSSFKQPHTHTIHWLYYILQLKRSGVKIDLYGCLNSYFWVGYISPCSSHNIIYHSVLNHFPKCGCRT